MNNSKDFDSWFETLTTHPTARRWQQEAARREAPRNLLLRIPTGLGKTEGVLAAWLFHRVHRGDDRWPRRLVWCLPVRVLVEQTVDIAKSVCARVPGTLQPQVGVLMGGEDILSATNKSRPH